MTARDVAWQVRARQGAAWPGKVRQSRHGTARLSRLGVASAGQARLGAVGQAGYGTSGLGPAGFGWARCVVAGAARHVAAGNGWAWLGLAGMS